MKGTLTEDNKVVFPSGQFVGEDKFGQEFIIPMIDDEVAQTSTATTEFVFTFDAEARTLTLSGDALIVEATAADPESQDFGVWTYLSEAVYTPYPIPEPVIAPEGLETETWYLAASSYNKGTIAGQEIKIGIDGTDIYMQGICYALPKAWIKGTIDAETNTATFATGQFFGKAAVEDEWGEETTYNLFFVGYGQGGIEDVVFDIVNEAGLMTTDQVIVLNKKRMTINFIDYFTNVIISKDYYGSVTAPDGLETETYLFKAVASKNGVEEVDEDYSAQVEVGFDGDDVYIKGISIDCLDFWVKATKNEAFTCPLTTVLGQVAAPFSTKKKRKRNPS